MSRHLDLVIELPGHAPLVVENKTFSLPDEVQLARYTEEAVSKSYGSAMLLLISLVDPGWPGGRFTVGGRTWRWVSYRALGQQLRAVFRNGTDFSTQVLAHEAKLVELLSDLLDVVAVQYADEPFQLPQSQIRLLDRANIADAVGKARAHAAMRLIRGRLREEGVAEPAWAPEVGSTSRQPLLSIYWDKGDGVIVGWQYQGGQWRLAMIVRRSDLVGRGRHDARARFASEHLDYFDFSTMYEVLDCTEQDTRPRRPRVDPAGFNRYDPDFVYRYRLLPQVTTGQFVDLAVAYSRRAAEWELAQDAPA